MIESTPHLHTSDHPKVGVVMGSSSDWEVMKNAVQVLRDFGVDYEARVVSAHRMPDEMFAYAETSGPGRTARTGSSRPS